LSTFQIDVHLKLAQFQTGLGQALLEQILAPNEDCAKVAAIGGELCIYRLVLHGYSHTHWSCLMRGQFYLDGLSHSLGHRHVRRMTLTEIGLG
jgi:hypothetical protein